MSSQSGTKKASKQAEAYWHEVIIDWESSGLKCLDYCQARGVDYNKFVYWRSKLLRQRLKDASKEAFAKVKARPKPKPLLVPGSNTSSSLTNNSSPPIKVNFPNGVVLTVPPRFDEASLKRLLILLGAKAC